MAGTSRCLPASRGPYALVLTGIWGRVWACTDSTVRVHSDPSSQISCHSRHTTCTQVCSPVHRPVSVGQEQKVTGCVLGSEWVTCENQNTLCPTAHGSVPLVQPTLSGSITVQTTHMRTRQDPTG